MHLDGSGFGKYNDFYSKSAQICDIADFNAPPYIVKQLLYPTSVYHHPNHNKLKFTLDFAVLFQH